MVSVSNKYNVVANMVV